jgi:hypothetical protein
MMTTDIHFEARIDPLADQSIHPSSWFITHGIGGPARKMFTEVVIPESTDDGVKLGIGDQSQIVRQVADQLYGTRWAFHYPPEDYKFAIQTDRWSLTRRERVVVTGVEVYS